MATRKPSDLIDKRVEALRFFSAWGRWPDGRVRGLYIHLGPRRSTWRFLAQYRVNGKRSSTFKTLGRWPEMDVTDARKQALIVAGMVAAGIAAPGKHEAMRFAPAFETYLDYLKTKAERQGKPPRWWRNARKYADKYLLPQWGNWTLYDLSQNPRAVMTWHATIAKHAPTSADHCARLLRACYRQEARLDRTLPPALPTSGIRFGRVRISERVLDFPDFPAWRAAWDAIENPVHRSYHLTALLTGCRPGELARIEQRDIDCIAETLTIRNSKSGKDITLPITDQIMFAINLSPCQGDFVFRGCSQIGHRSGLPVSGNALRHTYKTVAASLGIPETLSALLMGHALEGVSARYINEIALTRSAELRAAQATISRRMFDLLGFIEQRPRFLHPSWCTASRHGGWRSTR